MPTETDDVLIPCEWTVKLNLPTAKFNSIIIDGTLRFDEALPSTRLEVSYIWVRAGKILAG